MPRIIIKITGKVQRVFMRVYIKECAHVLGVTGSVQNMPDGSVEVHAQHFSEDVLKDFIEKMQEGSSLSIIEGVEVNWGEAEESLEHFRILE